MLFMILNFPLLGEIINQKIYKRNKYSNQISYAIRVMLYE
jgi:hypothetical protein